MGQTTLFLVAPFLSLDAAALQWINVEDEPDRLIQSNQIAFDHSRILTDFTNWRNATQRSDEENNKIPTFWSTKKREAGTEGIFRGKPCDRRILQYNL